MLYCIYTRLRGSAIIIIISILKRRIGIESEKYANELKILKVWKQVRNQKSMETS